MSDRIRLAVARRALLEARTQLELVEYENGTYHSIKYSVDGARDLALQAELNIDAALARLPPLLTCEVE